MALFENKESTIKELDALIEGASLIGSRRGGSRERHSNVGPLQPGS